MFNQHYSLPRHFPTPVRSRFALGSFACRAQCEEHKHTLIAIIRVIECSIILFLPLWCWNLVHVKKIMNRVFGCANDCGVNIYYQDTDSIHLNYEQQAREEMSTWRNDNVGKHENWLSRGVLARSKWARREYHILLIVIVAILLIVIATITINRIATITINRTATITINRIATITKLRRAPPQGCRSGPKAQPPVIVAIFYPFSQFCEINISLLSLQTQPNTAPDLFQRGVEYGKYDRCLRTNYSTDNNMPNKNNNNNNNNNTIVAIMI